ncbi:MAG TPA: hypothetical protein VFJ16_24805 [Longimicrobium sp.]|nr:hypothetical protein [Longimicrobium sp.]
MRLIKFKKHRPPYNAGETAGFDDETAQKFVPHDAEYVAAATETTAEAAPGTAASDESTAGAHAGRLDHLGFGKYRVLVGDKPLMEGDKPREFRGKEAATAALEAALAALGGAAPETPPANDAGTGGASASDTGRDPADPGA